MFQLLQGENVLQDGDPAVLVRLVVELVQCRAELVLRAPEDRGRLEGRRREMSLN